MKPHFPVWSSPCIPEIVGGGSLLQLTVTGGANVVIRGRVGSRCAVRGETYNTLAW